MTLVHEGYIYEFRGMLKDIEITRDSGEYKLDSTSVDLSIQVLGPVDVHRS